jgi:hypothetical protein
LGCSLLIKEIISPADNTIKAENISVLFAFPKRNSLKNEKEFLWVKRFVAVWSTTS